MLLRAFLSTLSERARTPAFEIKIYSFSFYLFIYLVSYLPRCLTDIQRAPAPPLSEVGNPGYRSHKIFNQNNKPPFLALRGVQTTQKHLAYQQLAACRPILPHSSPRPALTNSKFK